ncbi:Deoxyribodipyrimidine photo-lyase [Nostocoides japonicum T1-X7]|uniref:Deoxyribodipyrimidine photo-lyase n=1 Tax=Nostocoides japonicum T1-X7 TaxID=1194083 RepID=A0A077LSV3_9MICO|nr:Deoxyribodipyrimidine photo-lyase [Tetrasphaera japonica T1-X7]
MTVGVSILWLRRDLRLHDHPALVAAVDSGEEVLPVFVRDPVLTASGGVRVQRLGASLAALSDATGGALVMRGGDPADVLPELASEVGATTVHVTRETTPYGRRRDARVRDALVADGRALVATGTPYAVGPGIVRTRAGAPYQVFTPYSQAWRAHGWPAPAAAPGRVRWATGVDGDPVLDGTRPGGVATSGAGERAALERWEGFLADGLERYAIERDRPDLDTTSRMSVHLTYGEIHPRTMLADLARHPCPSSAGVQRLTTELAWREFHADVLWQHPGSAWRDLRTTLTALPYDEGPVTGELVERWRQGRTGYPFVDAGMRQLLAEGWMHNRLRMVTASFLVKDLHVWWPTGARHFLDHLLDGDIASNSHGWQWVAGTGTDASPWFRIFNPVDQGKRFDPAGDYIRRWVPELAHLDGPAAHEPWRHPDGYAHGYPERIVDHAEERRESLARYERARQEKR